jgi:hypothetical protein
MANFYNARHTQVNTAYEYPCLNEDIYIFGLKKGEILVSYNPSFMQNTNGLIIGIDSRFTRFYIINQTESIVKSLNLNWITDCTEKIDIPLINPKVDYITISTLCFLGLSLIIFFIKRRKKK